MTKYLACLASMLCIFSAHAGELVFAFAGGADPPLFEFKGGKLSGGIRKEMVDAIAQEMGATARYVILPRKRVESAVAEGQADMLCDLKPEWLDRRDWRWSEPLFSNDMIIATRSDTPAITAVTDVRGKRVGAVLGYRYPELEVPLGGALLRDDAPNDNQNLAKLLRHRFDYLLTNSIHFNYQRKVHPERARLNPDYFKVMEFDTGCGLPPHSKVDLAQLNRAIAALHRRGTYNAILDKYRPAK